MNYNQFHEDNPGIREAHILSTRTHDQVCEMECQEGNPRKGATYLKKSITTEK